MALRAIEIAAWSAGAALLAAYCGMQAWSGYASNQGLTAMRQARAHRAVAATEGASATLAADGAQRRDSLPVVKPDTSAWAPKRLAEYRSSLANNMVNNRADNIAHGMLPDAVLRIPGIRLEVPVYEGTSGAILNRGAGHIAATAAVHSETGNIGIAAHRDGFFRSLKDIKVGDAILLQTIDATRRYRVTRLAVVEPGHVSVLDPTPASTLTLVTCYPFYFVGAAPQRFIVSAQLD